MPRPSTLAIAAAVLAGGLVAAAGPAAAAQVQVWNLSTANPFGARFSVQDVQYADGSAAIPGRAVGRELRLGPGSVTGFTLVAQSPSGSLVYGIQCSADYAPGRVEIENPWSVSASGACSIARRGRAGPDDVIRWE